MTTLVVTPTFSLASSTSFSLFQGNGVNTASELASTALPTQLVFDSSVAGNPSGAATTGNAATLSVSPVLVGTADPGAALSSTDSSSSELPSSTSNSSSSSSSKKSNLPIAAIIMALVAVAAIAALFLFLWYRKRARRRGHGRMESAEFGPGPPASDVLRKLGSPYETTADPFSDSHAAEPSPNPFADPEKPISYHARTGSDPLGMEPPRRPYTHSASASTGSSASSKARKREMEEARKRDMSALDNLARALDQKDRQAQVEGRDRKSLPPVDLFKAALVR